jgi:GrpE
MENENVTIDEAVGSVSTLDDSLRSLRLRQYQAQTFWTPPVEKPDEADRPDEEDEDEAESGDAEETDEVEEEEIADEADEDADEVGAEEVGEEEVDAVVEEARRFFSESFDDLTQEVRRVGREMFRTNRTTERNQELFDDALGEIRELSSHVALIPAQYQETVAAAAFEAKADLCRELLRMDDALWASLAAADDLIQQFQLRAEEPQHGLAFRFATTVQLNESLSESVAAMKQWRTGQQLLADRLRAILRTAGVREIETLSRPFNPDLHRAVSVAIREDVAPGVIVGEELAGYVLEGRILRYAEVIVAKHE